MAKTLGSSSSSLTTFKLDSAKLPLSAAPKNSEREISSLLGIIQESMSLNSILTRTEICPFSLSVGSLVHDHDDRGHMGYVGV